ncbi:MAG: hypothetical protein AAGA25_01840 [Planctomycetota bacterium]
MRSVLAAIFCAFFIAPSFAAEYSPAQFTPATIRAIQANEVVVLKDGTYNITDARRNALEDLPNGVTIKAKNRHKAVLRETGSSTRVIEFTNKDGIDIDGIHFQNIALWFKSCDDIDVRWNKFDSFEDKTYDIRNAIIDVQNSEDTNIYRNNILWKDNTENNATYRGSQNKFLGNVVGIQIKNGQGGKHSISNNTVKGYLRTAIRYWSNYNTKQKFGIIKNNTCERYVAAPDSTSTKKFEDHGLYVLFGSNLRIFNNTVKGWSASSSGGSLKIKWYNVAEITANQFHNSGILFRNKLDNLYVFDNNMINTGPWAAQFYHTSSSETITGLYFAENNLGGSSLLMSWTSLITSGQLNSDVEKISGSIAGAVVDNSNGTLNVPFGTRYATSFKNNGMTVNKF